MEGYVGPFWVSISDSGTKDLKARVENLEKIVQNLKEQVEKSFLTEVEIPMPETTELFNITFENQFLTNSTG